MTFAELEDRTTENEDSAVIRSRVEKAVKIQATRFQGTDIRNNSRMGQKEIQRFCKLKEPEKRFARRVYEARGISARGYHRVCLLYTSGSRLATYAARCVENEILMLLRAGKKRAREVSLFEPIGTDKDGEAVNLVDVIEMENPRTIDQLILDQDIRELYEAFDT